MRKISESAVRRLFLCLDAAGKQEVIPGHGLAERSGVSSADSVRRVGAAE